MLSRRSPLVLVLSVLSCIICVTAGCGAGNNTNYDPSITGNLVGSWRSTGEQEGTYEFKKDGTFNAVLESKGVQNHISGKYLVQDNRLTVVIIDETLTAKDPEAKKYIKDLATQVEETKGRPVSQGLRWSSPDDVVIASSDQTQYLSRNKS